MYGGLSLQMPEVNSDCFPLMGVAILGVILHRWVSPFSMGHPCCLLCSVDYPCIGRCRRSCLVIPADARSQQLLSSIGGCRRSCLVILHRWVSPFPVLSLQR